MFIVAAGMVMLARQTCARVSRLLSEMRVLARASSGETQPASPGALHTFLHGKRPCLVSCGRGEGLAEGCPRLVWVQDCKRVRVDLQQRQNTAAPCFEGRPQATGAAAGAGCRTAGGGSGDPAGEPAPVFGKDCARGRWCGRPVLDVEAMCQGDADGTQGHERPGHQRQNQGGQAHILRRDRAARGSRVFEKAPQCYTRLEEVHVFCARIFVKCTFFVGQDFFL